MLRYTHYKTTKHSSDPEDIHKSTKNFLEKLNTKEETTTTTISKVLSKIHKRKKIPKQQNLWQG